MKELSVRRVSNTWINDEFGELKAIREFGDWWFEAYTVAKKLGYRNPALSVKQHVWKEFMRNDIPGCVNKINGLNKIMLNISGVLQLIMSSKADNAKRFQKWIYVDVLPSIMFNGGYIRNQEKLPEDERNKLLNTIHNLEQEVSNARKTLGMTGESKKRDAKEYRTLSMQFKAKADELDEEGDNILSNMNEMPNETGVFEGNNTK